MTLDRQLREFHALVIGETSLAETGDLVREDGDIDAATRMGVYRHAYFARIAGALAKDYPKLRALVGDDAFDAWIVPFLRAHPPTNFSLREVGQPFPAFLADPLHRDLARLERARVEAFDGADAAPLGRETVAALPPEEFPSLRLQLVPTAQLLALATNADDVWDALEDERPAPAPSADPRTAIVWRRDLTVIHRTLEVDEARALARVAMGATFATVCEQLVGPVDAVPRAIELLLRWIDAEVLAG